MYFLLNQSENYYTEYCFILDNADTAESPSPCAELRVETKTF